MGLFEQFPYANFHELNLDWFLKTFKNLLVEWAAQKVEFADLKEAWKQLHDYVENYFDNLDVQDEINNKLDDMMQSGELQTILDGLFLSFETAYNDRLAFVEKYSAKPICNAIEMQKVFDITQTGSNWLQGSCFTDNYFVVALVDNEVTELQIFDKDSFVLLNTISSLNVGHANTICFYDGYIYIPETFVGGNKSTASNIIYKIAEADLLNVSVTPVQITLSFTTNGFGYGDDCFVFYCVDRDFSYVRITDTSFNVIRDVTLPYQYNSIVSIDYYNGYYVISRQGFNAALPSHKLSSIEVYNENFDLMETFVIPKDYPEEIESCSCRRSDGTFIIGMAEGAFFTFYEQKIILGGMIYPSQADAKFISNENVLVNANFLKPINTLGFASLSGLGSEDFITDKWFGYISSSGTGSGVISLESAGLHMTSTGLSVGITQTFQDECIQSKPAKYTLSAEVEIISGGYNLIWGNGKWNVVDSKYITKSGISSFTFDFYHSSQLRAVRVVCTPNSEIIVKKVKLEHGRASTLMFDGFRNSVRDVNICKNYVKKIQATTTYGLLGWGVIRSGKPWLIVENPGMGFALADKRVGTGAVSVRLLDDTTLYNGTVTFESNHNVSSGLLFVGLNGTGDLSAHNGEPFLIVANNNTDASFTYIFDA